MRTPPERWRRVAFEAPGSPSLIPTRKRLTESDRPKATGLFLFIESTQPPRRNTRTDSRDRNRGQFVPMPQLAKTRMLARLSGLNQAPADGFGGIQPVQTLNRRLRIPPFLVRTIVQFWWARAPRESVAARYASALGPAGLYLRMVSLRPSVRRSECATWWRGAVDVRVRGVSPQAN